MARALAHPPGEHAAAVREERRRYQHLFQDLVEEGQKAGVFRGDMAASVIANTFLSSVVQIHRWFHAEGPLTRRELGTQMVSLFLDGVRVG